MFTDSQAHIGSTLFTHSTLEIMTADEEKEYIESLNSFMNFTKKSTSEIMMTNEKKESTTLEIMTADEEKEYIKSLKSQFTELTSFMNFTKKSTPASSTSETMMINREKESTTLEIMTAEQSTSVSSTLDIMTADEEKEYIKSS